MSVVQLVDCKNMCCSLTISKFVKEQHISIEREMPFESILIYSTKPQGDSKWLMSMESGQKSKRWKKSIVLMRFVSQEHYPPTGKQWRFCYGCGRNNENSDIRTQLPNDDHVTAEIIFFFKSLVKQFSKFDDVLLGSNISLRAHSTYGIRLAAAWFLWMRTERALAALLPEIDLTDKMLLPWACMQPSPHFMTRTVKPAEQIN